MQSDNFRNPQQPQSLLYQDEQKRLDEDQDISFLIKNLDTGEQIDARNDSHLETMLSQLSPSISPDLKVSLWKDFWDNVKEINVQLWDAAELGKTDVVISLVQNQYDLRKDYSFILKKVKANDHNEEFSPIETKNEETDEYRQLLDVNSRSLDGWTALHFAINEGHKDIVEILLEFKADPSLSTSMKRTPLHLACLRNYFEIVKMLVAHPLVDIDAQDTDFNTSLHIASELGLKQIVEYLIDHNCNSSLLNYQQKMAYDQTLYQDIRQTIRQKTGSFTNHDPSKSYQRSELGGIIVPNSRSDHVEKMMVHLRKDPAKLNQSRTDSGYSIQSSTNRMKSRLQLFARMSINLKNNICPQTYAWHKLLGKGSFGEVYLASRKSDNTLYAIKVLSKEKVYSKNLIRYAQTEKHVLSVMNHPFIVKLHAAFQNQAKLFLVLDYCPGGDLGSMLSRFTRFSEEVARFYICEIILAIECLHRNCIIFRDLKPDNVVIDPNGHARLTDFGLSKEGVYNNITKSFCGSIAYLSPEVLLKRGHSRTVDWYLVGVLLYELIVGIPPYYNQNRDQLFENIKKGPLRIPKAMSEDAKDLIKQLLVRDPSQRLGVVNDAADIKIHPFFKDINWDEVEQKAKDGPYVDKDKTKMHMKENIEVNFDMSTPDLISRQKISDWSFIQNQ